MSSNRRVVLCNEKDQEKLLIFKQGIIDPYNLLSTWSSSHDCCAWEGVQCDNTTGGVTSLDLHSFNLKGEINLSLLLQLEFLKSLYLSSNNFTNISIQPLHHSITNTTSLYHLDLSDNDDLHIDNLHWLSRLSSLKYLNLNGINLQKQTNWLQMVAMLPSLSELYLINCQLTNTISSLNYLNFTSLETLDVSDNKIKSDEFPHWLNLPNLKYLFLWGNQLKGSIPSWLGQLEYLLWIDLSHNSFSGSIPSSLGNLSSLMYLDISSNLLTGNLPQSIGQLSNLNTLFVGNNSLAGALSEIHFSNLSQLYNMDLSSSRFEFQMDSNWVPSFQLWDIDLSNTVLGPKIPAWLYTQSSLVTLDLSSTGISSMDENKFQSFVAGIAYLYLSNNFISADISNVMLRASVVCLEHNNFTGRLPLISANADVVDVSHNSFSGGFPNTWVNWTNLFYIDMSSNKLAGQLPLDMSNLTQMFFMNLENNEFSGRIPIKMPPNLTMLAWRSNNFQGNIPSQLCDLSALQILDLSHNKLSGPIPQCLYKIANMVLVENESSSYKFREAVNLITKGQDLPHVYVGLLRAIDLSVNNLHGEIPPELFRHIKVESLNLSHNHLTGKIPKMTGDMTNLESLDLSYNQLCGEIPQTMSGSTFLEVLNLSYNNFSGQIPLGPQFQTFEAWSYIGNPELCGPPLTKNCTPEETMFKTKQHARDDSFRESLYLGMGVGFAVSFWGVCGFLFLNKTWRHAYFRFLNHVVDKIYVIVALKFRNFGASL